MGVGQRGGDHLALDAHRLQRPLARARDRHGTLAAVKAPSGTEGALDGVLDGNSVCRCVRSVRGERS
jgi:hypothetical protein